ncbi:MAG: DNA (cytosine-5-)-methyltransferase [Oscillospiraceae bacterium]|nr:DNA (cytosine-5-)-methyltransferase [Oscillospiraceae bacterium]
MRALSLFSGCGGLDLAAESAGVDVVGQCEIDRHCNKVLEHWWPGVPRWEDVRDVTAKEVYERCGDIDLIFGGPPCQPVSVAGRRGAAGDSRNMWPEFIRVIRDVKPQWVVAENPTGIISAQKIKGDPGECPKGEFFGEVVRDIAALGYSVGWGVWGACDVGAPHKRERIFIVAYNPSVGWSEGQPEPAGQQRKPGFAGGSGSMADTARQHIDRPEPPWRGRGRLADGSPVGNTEHDGPLASAFPRGHAPPVRGGTERSQSSVQSPGAGSPGVLPGEPVADTRSSSLRDDGQDERPTGGEINQTPDPGTYCGELGDPGCVGPPEQPMRVGSQFEDRALREGLSSQPGVGGAADGFPARVDFPGWPAGRGQVQYPWEPPRVVPSKSVDARTHKIKMLGNAVVPQQAGILFSAIINIWRSIE